MGLTILSVVPGIAAATVAFNCINCAGAIDGTSLLFEAAPDMPPVADALNEAMLAVGPGLRILSSLSTSLLYSERRYMSIDLFDFNSLKMRCCTSDRSSTAL
jgi:hypothetical protein